MCLFFHKSGRFSLAKLRRKRRSLGTGRLRKKTQTLKPRLANSQNQQPKIIVGPVEAASLRITNSEQHYRAPSATSADSGLSTISVGSCSIQSGRNQKAPVVIYDDPPEFGCEPTSTISKKRSQVQDYLSEFWRRTKPGNGPPPPPVPDYRGSENGDLPNISESLSYDVYAALEDPTNWDPPEQFWSLEQESPQDRASPDHCDKS